MHKQSFFAPLECISWVPLAVTLTVIGEQLELSDDITGLVIVFRPNDEETRSGGCFVSVWNRTSNNQELISSISEELKTALLEFPQRDPSSTFTPRVNYKTHKFEQERPKQNVNNQKYRRESKRGERQYFRKSQHQKENRNKREHIESVNVNDYKVEIVNENNSGWTTVVSHKKGKTSRMPQEDKQVDEKPRDRKEEANDQKQYNATENEIVVALEPGKEQKLTEEALKVHDKHFEAVLLQNPKELTSWADDADDEEHSFANNKEYVYQVSAPEWARGTIEKKRKSLRMSFCSDNESDDADEPIKTTTESGVIIEKPQRKVIRPHPEKSAEKHTKYKQTT